MSMYSKLNASDNVLKHPEATSGGTACKHCAACRSAAEGRVEAHRFKEKPVIRRGSARVGCFAGKKRFDSLLHFISQHGSVSVHFSSCRLAYGAVPALVKIISAANHLKRNSICQQTLNPV